MSSVLKKELIAFEEKLRKAADIIHNASELVADGEAIGPEGVFAIEYPPRPQPTLVDPTKKKIDGRAWLVCPRPSCHGAKHRANHPHFHTTKRVA